MQIDLVNCGITRPEPSPSGHFQPVTSTHTHTPVFSELSHVHTFTFPNSAHVCALLQYSLLRLLSLSVSHSGERPIRPSVDTQLKTSV